MADVGLTHVALPVTNMEASLAFYATYAQMRVVHRRTAPDGTEVVWLSDQTRPFVLVLIQASRVEAPLLPLGHLGIGCATRQEVDALCAQARSAGCLRQEPTDSGSPVGYWAFLSDPDGHTLEIAHGQEIGLAVAPADARQPAG